jgi:hypothetical protein
VNAEIKWAIQLGSTLLGLVALIETGRKRGWL